MPQETLINLEPSGCSISRWAQFFFLISSFQTNLPLASATVSEDGDRMNLHSVLSTFAQSGVFSFCYCVLRCRWKIYFHAYLINTVCSNRLWLRLWLIVIMISLKHPSLEQYDDDSQKYFPSPSCLLDSVARVIRWAPHSQILYHGKM